MPPCVKDTWETNSPSIQAYLLGYNQRREYDETKEQIEFLKALR